jgi:hypothetical protein
VQCRRGTFWAWTRRACRCRGDERPGDSVDGADLRPCQQSRGWPWGTPPARCPVTRAPLADYTLIPNHTLRRLIQEWCVERIPTPADPDLVRSLVEQGPCCPLYVGSSWPHGRPGPRLLSSCLLRGASMQHPTPGVHCRVARAWTEIGLISWPKCGKGLVSVSQPNGLGVRPSQPCTKLA